MSSRISRAISSRSYPFAVISAAISSSVISRGSSRTAVTRLGRRPTDQ
jgi:hypothetical protein